MEMNHRLKYTTVVNESIPVLALSGTPREAKLGKTERKKNWLD